MAHRQDEAAPGPGSQPVTLYDVARLAGVSTATVSRVVHGQDRVKDSTRLRVRAVIEQLGYVPDSAAQSLSRRRKDVIGLVCIERRAKQYDIENMNLLYYDEILRGVEARLRDDSTLSLLITFLQGEHENDWPRLRSLSAKVDGLLIAEGIVTSPNLALLAERVPVVVIAGDPDEQAADVVTADNRSGSAALVEHLITEHGKRRLYYIDGPRRVADARQRRLALEEVLRAHPGCELVGSYQGLFNVQSGEEAAMKLATAPRESLPDAVVCANDQTAIGVLQAFARHGLRVPEDVAVVGFDDIYPCSLSRPPLTTVHQPMGLLGEQACTRLLDRIAMPGLPARAVLLPTELVLRSSCGCKGEMRRPVAPLAASGLGPGFPDSRAPVATTS